MQTLVRHQRSSDFEWRCAGDVLKSCKHTGKARLPALLRLWPGVMPRPGPEYSVWQIL